MLNGKSLDVEIPGGDLVFFNHQMVGFFTLFYEDYQYICLLAQNQKFFSTEDHFGLLLSMTEHNKNSKDLFMLTSSDSLAVWYQLYALAGGNYCYSNFCEKKVQCCDELVCDEFITKRAV
jgi:hypothetical protein